MIYDVLQTEELCPDTSYLGLLCCLEWIMTEPEEIAAEETAVDETVAEDAAEAETAADETAAEEGVGG